MAGLRVNDRSATADALLLAALFLPYLPIVTTYDLYFARLALGCSAEIRLACDWAGLDFNYLFARSAAALKWTAAMSASGVLLLYILLVAGLSQFTTTGFRGRVVRTCATVMWAGVIPLVLGLASAAVHGLRLTEGGPFTSFAFYGNVFFDWLRDIAVPLAVLITAFVALTLGYRLLINRFVSLVTQRD